MKNKLLKILDDYTNTYDVIEKECFTAQYLANELEISRNTVSQYLNEFIKDDKVIKIMSRPVYFYSKSELIKKGYDIQVNIFNEFKSFNTKNKDFEKLIGANGSLKHVIEQCKAAVSYPDNGLPILINGPTGTGKSMLAKLMYEYAINNSIIDKTKKIIMVNCSEYSNNPELLTANLFGHVKGAYTGADKDNLGLVNLANGGFLFLDEVHCLKSECQEKLFLFMDQGIYHKVGDNEKWYTSNCRFIFATTQNPEDALLKTLLRRIPLITKIPALVDRSKDEKKKLIAHLIKNESNKINRKIQVGNLAYQMLLDTNLIGNVGGLVNAIKVACANAYLTNEKSDDSIKIMVYNLPDSILDLAPSINIKLANNYDSNQFVDIDIIDSKDGYTNKLLNLYSSIIDSYKKYKENPLINDIFNKEMHENIENYDAFIMYDSRKFNNSNSDFIKKVCDKVISIEINKYSLKISNSEILLISQYLSEYTQIQYKIKDWLNTNQVVISDLNEDMQQKYPREYAISCEVAHNFQINLDIEMDSLMIIRLMLMIIDFNQEETSNKVVSIILCHGYSTASSIANAVNKMLGQHIFDAIDMQLDISVDKITEMLNEFLKKKAMYENILLLVDMGSLTDIYMAIKHRKNVNVGIIDNVSTKLALYVGNGVKNNEDLDSLLNKCCQNVESTHKYIVNDNKKKAILFVCATGIGSAHKFLELFTNSLPREIDAEVITYDYNSLVENKNCDVIFSRYEVKAILGTLNPFVEGVDFVPIENFVLNNNFEEIKSIIGDFLNNDEIEEFRENVVKNFTLNNIVNNLTILNAEKVLDDVEQVVEKMEKKLNNKILISSRIGLCVHLSCLIERLILKNEVILNNDPVEFIENNKEFIKIIKESFSVVEMRYSVEIPISEIIYIFNYVENM